MKGIKFSKEHKINIGLAHKGKVLTEEHKKNITKNRRTYKGINNPFYGKHHTQITKDKISKRKIELDLHKGNKNGRWIDGRSFEPYTNNFKPLRESIRKRDNYRCQLCYKHQNNHFINNKNEKLSIHHIDYNKKNCNPNNLITLCRKCNSIVNTNRDYWYAYFKYIMENR
jgi:5-methylcytosine-specific restriction endonuclease McrA